MCKKSLAILCIATLLHSIAAVEPSSTNQNNEPSIAIPVAYAHEGQLFKTADGQQIVRNFEKLPTTVINLPVSKVLLDGLKYRLPQAVQSSLEKQAINYVDSSELHSELKGFLENKLAEKRVRYGLHAFVGAFDIVSLALCNQPGTGGLGLSYLCLCVLVHNAIEFDYKKTMRKKYDPIIAYLLRHKAFSSPRHSGINRYLQKSLLKHYSKEQLKKLQTKYLN